MLLIGLFTAKKANNIANFTVGGRKAGPWFSALSYGTTYFSAVVFIGYAGNSGWNFGLWAVLIGIGNALIGSLLAWLVLANRTREVTQRLKIKSMPQFFEKRYNSRNMRIFTSIIIFIFLIPYSASVYSGLSFLCERVLGIPYVTCAAIIAVASAVSLVLGGYLAALKADFMQGIIMIGGVICLIVVITFSSQVGGFSGLSVLAEKMEAKGIASLDLSQTSKLVSLILLTSLGTWGLPQMIHKFYGIADKASVKRGTIISTFYCLLISGGAYYIGSLSHMFMDQPPRTASGLLNYDAIVPETLILARLPVLLLGIVLVLVLSASVSTLSGLTLTSASSISLDLIGTTVKKNMKETQKLLLTRILCFVFIVFSFTVAAFRIEAILNLMAFSWGAIAGSFLAPYLLALYWKGINRTGAWAGIISGLVFSLGLNIMDVVKLGKFSLPNAPLNGVIAMAVSMALSVLISLAAKALRLRGAMENTFFYEGSLVEQERN